MQGRGAVAKRTADDDESVGHEAVHERRMIVPCSLLADGERWVPAGTVNQCHRERRHEVTLAPPTDHDGTVADEEWPERSFGWSNMFVAREDDPRESGESPKGERATLVRFLHDYRLTLELKCSGLDAEAMASRSVPPSDMSLLGLVRHMTDVERHWFRRVMDGQDAPPLYWNDADPDADFDGAVADPGAVNVAWDAWRAEVGFAERFVDEAPDLDVTGHYDDGLIQLRVVLVHMIEEYARHCGHADFLRERIDGRVGQ